jgi:ribosomal protein S18 acetylase RimI-like enzyme
MIRTYQEKDIERIMEIGNAAWQEIYRMYRQVYGEELYKAIIPDEKTKKGLEVKGFAEAHPQWLFICEEEGCVVGFITFRLDYNKRIGEIGNNAVDLNYRQKGIGQQMYKAVLEQFRKEGMLFAKVHTGLDYAHAPARKAYERAGFNIHHEDVSYFMKL